jgi:hypothetical protein
MLSTEQAAIVKGLLARGDKQHEIAAFFGVNGGRIAEIKTGAKHSTVKPASARRLPSSEDLLRGHAVVEARTALLNARAAIDAALQHLE